MLEEEPTTGLLANDEGPSLGRVASGEVGCGVEGKLELPASAVEEEGIALCCFLGVVGLDRAVDRGEPLGVMPRVEARLEAGMSEGADSGCGVVEWLVVELVALRACS